MNKLVVYFSYTKNTEKIANMIKEKLNCDILKLEKEEPYPNDYQTVVDMEKDNETIDKVVKIKKIDKDLSRYDEIIIGTPVWWYSITPVIRTFLKENNLKGKLIIPFITNAGWEGNAFLQIEALCPDSTIDKKMNIVFESYSSNLVTSEEKINKWIESL